MKNSRNHYGQGRNIDPGIGLLKGEASSQLVASEREHPQKAPVVAWKRLPVLREGQEISYYARPPVKEPVWIWSVPLYFHIGGIAGAAAVLAATLQVREREDFARLRIASRWIGAGGTTLGSLLLIYDLGRPSRFLYMLRVVRPTSPMSLGSWTLAKSGGALSLSLLAETKSSLAPVGRAAGMVGGLLGLPLAGYTGVLLGNTAVPLWQGARMALPALFTGSGAAGLADILEFLPLERREKIFARRLGTFGKIAELSAAQAVEQTVSRTPQVAKPLKHGKSGRMWKTAKGLIAAGLVLSVLPEKHRWQKKGAAIFGGAGALLLRYAIFEAGKVSSQDPQATFSQSNQPENSQHKGCDRKGKSNDGHKAIVSD